MKQHLRTLYPLWCGLLLFALTACHTSAPRLDYEALAKASVRLGMDVEWEDNHDLYLQAARWIGTPYRAGGSSRQGTDCSGLAYQLYKQVYHIRLSRSTDGQLAESKKISRRRLREGDLVFFTSRASRKKVAHVGIYLKDDKFIHASTSQGVIVSSLKEDYYTRHWLCGGRLTTSK
ncbi:MAG: C40 family peptidase [Bacteroides sp.]|nr:C40 family peptidase [Bacteroides sp.]